MKAEEKMEYTYLLETKEFAYISKHSPSEAKSQNIEGCDVKSKL